MRGARGRAVLVLAVAGALWHGCQGDEPKPVGPSAEHREGRSDVLRGLMASREKVDPNALRSSAPAAEGVASGGGTDLPGQGGSGPPAPSRSMSGEVTWVGDNELLVRDAGGAEREVQVGEDTRMRWNGEPVRLPELSEGQEVRVAYDDTPGGWVAREVEVVPSREAPPPAGEEREGTRASPPR